MRSIIGPAVMTGVSMCLAIAGMIILSLGSSTNGKPSTILMSQSIEIIGFTFLGSGLAGTVGFGAFLLCVVSQPPAYDTQI